MTLDAAILDAGELQRRARQKWAALERKRADRRYTQTMAQFVAAGLLTSNQQFPKYRGKVTLAAALFAGELEPRILELLPAVLLKKPGFLAEAAQVPLDLKQVLHAVRHAQPPAPFRGIPPASFLKWVPLLGHRNKVPSVSKTYRLQRSDLELLRDLQERLGVSETDVIRLGLKALHKNEVAERNTRGEVQKAKR